MKLKVQIEEAQSRFQEMLESALKGRDVLIMDKKKAVARLIRVDTEQNDSKGDKWPTDDFDIELADEQ
jgi:antitoxin (DNA-binding transcriptional repressor) of toxin-antitoxin stability system